MATTIKYSDIIAYLEAIANNANNDVSQATHGYWWRINPSGNDPTTPLSYNHFINGTVHNKPVAIINQADPTQSMFYLLLSTPGGTGGYPEMPRGGFTNSSGATVYLPDPSCQITLADGSTIAGTQILATMLDWLSNGYPQ
jgi:hypothetical protein